MARKSLKDLVNKALGVDEINETDTEAEELLDIVTPATEAVVIKSEAPIDNKEVIKVETAIKTETAFNVVYNKTTKKYILVTIEYKEDGTAKIVSEEPFATVLPEVNYKIGQLLYEKLKYSLSSR